MFAADVNSNKNLFHKFGLQGEMRVRQQAQLLDNGSLARISIWDTDGKKQKSESQNEPNNSEEADSSLLLRSHSKLSKTNLKEEVSRT